MPESTDLNTRIVAIESDGIEKKLETPRLAFYSRCGAIPYLNWNFVRRNDGIIFREDGHVSHQEKDILLVNVGDLMILQSNNCLDSFGEMKYLEDFATMVTLFEPLEKYNNFKSTENAVPVLSIQGKELIAVDKMVQIAKQSNSALFQSVADINVPATAGKKWTQKSSSRSNRFLEETVQMMKNESLIGDSKKVKRHQPKIWASLSGGYSVRDRKEACEFVNKFSSQIDGIVIESLYGYNLKPRKFAFADNNNEENGKEDKEQKNEENGNEKSAQENNTEDKNEEPKVEDYFVDNYQDAAEILKEVIIPNLPSNVPRALFGCFYPDDMLRLICVGIDILDSSICTLLTQNALALPSPLISVEDNKLNFHRPHSLPDIDSEKVSGCLLNLSNPKYQRSLEVISTTCECYTCKSQFSRGYLNHLYKRNELNAPMLLQIHNHFVITRFFHDIRTLLSQDRQKLEQLLKNSDISF